MKRLLSVCLALVIAVPGLLGGEKPRFRRDAPPALQTASEAALFEVDFSHSPVACPVAICFPDEWQKPISGMGGALVYPGPDREGSRSLLATNTVVRASLEGLTKGVTRQRLRDPRIPIVETLLKYRRSDAFLRCTTFSVAPAPECRLPVYVPGPGDSVKIESTTTPRLLPGWGRPAVPCIDAFRNIVAGFTCHVGYRFRVAQGAVHDVALGFMESHHDAAGMRVIDLFIENEKVLTVDLIADIGRHKAAAFVFEARDLDGDGFVSVDVKPARASRDRYPILNALWVFRRGAAPPPELLVRGEAGRSPLGMVDCGGAAASMEKPSPGPPRADLMLLEKGAGAGAIRVTVYSYSPEQPFAEAGGRCLFLSGRRFLSASAPWERVEVSPCSLSRWFVVLTFPEEVREVALYCASGHEAGDVDLQWAKAEEERAASRWNSLDLPCGAIRVPDGNIQALLHASIRGLYQARTVERGHPVFKTGLQPLKEISVEETASICEALALLGRGLEARAVIERLLAMRGADGSFEVIDGNWRENGIVLQALLRHARLTGDGTWLLEHWHVFQEAVAVIRRLRDRSLENPGAPEAGLMPPGFPGCIIGGLVSWEDSVPEYASVYFNLAGLRAAVEAARFLGVKTPETMSWEAEYADFIDRFHRAAARDLQRLEDGTAFLPILMRREEGWNTGPAFGQEAFCRAVHPGRIFSAGDPLVTGNMAFLRSMEHEGLIRGTGVYADNRVRIDSAACYGRAALWIGDGLKAAKVLYAFANHASPLLAWSDLEGSAPPHIGAEFVGLVRRLLVLERGEEIHLLEGLPPSWLTPGAETALCEAATEFGLMSLSLCVADDGSEARLLIQPPPGFPAERLVVHRGAWAAAGEPAVFESSGRPIDVRIDLMCFAGPKAGIGRKMKGRKSTPR